MPLNDWLETYRARSTCASCAHSSGTVDNTHCAKLDKIIDYHDPKLDCPIGMWTSAIGRKIYLMGSSPEPEQVAPPLDQAIIGWADAKPTWISAMKWLTKVRDLGAAVVSGFADDATVAKRKESCATCVKRYTKDGHDYCSACGCGEWVLARLDEAKLKFADLKCPLRKPGFSNEEKHDAT